MRRLVLLLLLVPATAQEGETRIDWVGDWEKAFEIARKTDRPVMVCINSKDGETANERTAKKLYRDPAFVRATRKWVMLVVSTITHRTEGKCPRFGKVTCQDHLNCWKELRARHGDQFRASAMSSEMISPQHAWFKPDGTLLRRLEYETRPHERFKDELLKRMQLSLDELAGKVEPPPEEKPPPEVESPDAPLNDRDRAELERLKSGDPEARQAALGNLLATEKNACREAIVALLLEAKDTNAKCQLLRALGRARVLEAREAIEGFLKDKDELVRSFAAVALEELADVQSVPALVKRKRERDTLVRKNVFRALGACGGPAADEKAAKTLLRAITADKQNAVRKHAALALRHYEGAAAEVVLKKLERLALKVKDSQVRGGVVYTLAHIGNTETTLPVFEELLEDMHDEWRKRFMRTAIARLKGETSDFGRAGWWLYREDRDDPARRETAGSG